MPRRRDRRPPSTGPGEKEVLLGFLDHLRDAVAAKAEGVPEPQVRAAGVPSGTSLLGLVSHLTSVERWSFLGQDVPDWAATWRVAPGRTAADVLADYREAVRQSNEAVASWDDLSEPAPRPAARRSGPSRRWLLVHMVEETGRHAGHADVLRELVDGSTGR